MIQNGGFEEAGSTAAIPAGWTASFVSSLEEVADFDGNATDATVSQENFEGGWAPDPQVLIAAFAGNTIDLETPVFNFGDIQGPLEGFERGWHAPVLTLIATLPGAESAGFDIGSPEAVEDFEEEWGNIHFVLPIGILIETAMFDAGTEAFEDFGEGWSNDVYPVVYPAVSPPLTAAIFDTTEPVEDFEESQAPEPGFVTVGSNRVAFDSLPSNAISTGDGLRFSSDSELPTPLKPNTTYYATGSVVWNSFTIAMQPSGATIDLTDEGSGTFIVYRDPAKWWSTLLSTV